MESMNLRKMPFCSLGRVRYMGKSLTLCIIIDPPKMPLSDHILNRPAGRAFR
jgi:hypothetical protein